MSKKIIVSGIKPSGELHLGNYLGAIKQFLELQKKHDLARHSLAAPIRSLERRWGDGGCYFFVADLHSLTETFDPQEKKKEIYNLVINLLALGLDPKKCTFFVQSQVPQCLELAWIFDCLTPVAFLERMTQYKDFIARQTQSANAGLLTYPTLQAADILLYHGTMVPVGRDQFQHIELTNDIVKFFNNKFGNYFAPVEPFMAKVPKVMSLTDPERKMSKSDGEKTYIALRDEPDVIFEKIKRAPTGTGLEGVVTPGAKNLLELYQEFGDPKKLKQFETAIKDKTIKYSQLKDSLAKAIADHFAPFRKRYKELEKDKKGIEKILQLGRAKAGQVAIKTMDEVKKKIGIL